MEVVTGFGPGLERDEVYTIYCFGCVYILLRVCVKVNWIGFDCPGSQIQIRMLMAHRRDYHNNNPGWLSFGLIWLLARWKRKQLNVHRSVASSSSHENAAQFPERHGAARACHLKKLRFGGGSHECTLMELVSRILKEARAELEARRDASGRAQLENARILSTTALENARTVSTRTLENRGELLVQSR